MTAATSIEREGRFDCEVTRQRMTALAASMGSLDAIAKTQSETMPATAVETWQRITGPRGSGLKAVAQFEAERQRYDVLSAAARANNCATGDIDVTYARAVEKMTAFRTGR